MKWPPHLPVNSKVKSGVFQYKHLLTLWIYYPDNDRFCIIVTYELCVSYLYGQFFIYPLYCDFNILNKGLFFLPTAVITWLLRKKLF